MILQEDEDRLTKKVQEVVRSYIGDPIGLAQGLKGCEQITLAELVWGFQRLTTEVKHKDVPFEAWPDLASTILDAARIRPEVMLPKIVQFFVAGGRSWEFKADVADRLFKIVKLKDVFAYSDEVFKQVAKEDAGIVEFVRQRLSI